MKRSENLHPATPKTAATRCIVAAAAATMLAAASLGAQPPSAADTETTDAPVSFLESIDVNLVNIEVYVADKKGNALTDLTAKDFQLFEDGKKMKLTNFAEVGAAEAAAAAPDAAAPAAVSERVAPAEVREPPRIALLVDNLTIHPQNRRLLLDEVRQFIERGMAGGTEMMIASYEGHLRIRQWFTRDRQALLRQITAMEELSPIGVLRATERRSVLRQGLQTLQEINRSIGSDTRGTESARYLSNYGRQVDLHAGRLRTEIQGLLFSVSHLVNALAAFPGRKALVYVSDGIPMQPGAELYYAIQEASRELQPDLFQSGSTDARSADINNRSAALGALGAGVQGDRRAKERGDAPAQGVTQLAALANASGVSFYPIKVLANLGGIPAELEGDAATLYTPQLRSVRESNLTDTLRVMADATGGEAGIGADIQELLDGAQADLGRYYSLAYAPPHSGDGKYHEIEVKVRGKGKGLKVRYRNGYVDKPLAAKLADRTSAAMLLGLQHNPLRVSFEVGDTRPGPEEEQWIVTLKVAIPLDKLTLTPAGDLLVADLEIYIGAEGIDGRIAPVQGGQVRIEVPASEPTAGRAYAAELPLLLREGGQRVSLGIVDPRAGNASFVSRELVVGEP